MIQPRGYPLLKLHCPPLSPTDSAIKANQQMVLAHNSGPDFGAPPLQYHPTLACVSGPSSQVIPNWRGVQQFSLDWRRVGLIFLAKRLSANG